jgi:hypothetical protein
MFQFKSWVFAVTCASLAAGCTEASLTTDEIGQNAQALCANGDGVNSAMAALAVATAKELERWESTRDFHVDKKGRLALTRTGKAQCSDGKCWNTQALLDLQKAPDGTVELGGEAFNAETFRSQLSAGQKKQEACEARAGTGKSGCAAEEHKLAFQSQQAGACDTLFTFAATTPEGGPLKRPAQLKNKLIYVGYPENEYLSFTSTGSTVSIDPTYGLNDDGSTSTGSCSAACVKISSTNVAGQCCSCNGTLGEYVRSGWSAVTFLCS